MKAFKKPSSLVQGYISTILILISSQTNALAADPNVRVTSTAAVAEAQQAVDLNRYYSPFSANSFWKSRPVSPTFLNYTIPTSWYAPYMHEGEFSTGCFYASNSDGPVTVNLSSGQKGVYDNDAESYQSQVVIPHWPADVVPASGADGHADIYDVAAGVIHTFWKLKNDNGVWNARVYSWAPINGSGWPDPAHYYQGVRAAGVSSCAGIIRKHEFQSADTIYPHALAISMAANGLAKDYVFPATAVDSSSSYNTGQIPEGALVMLPPDFDISRITTPEVRKVAKTLQVYGAYVVDRNGGVPFIVYVENGSGLNLSGNKVASGEMHLIRANLRMVTSAKSWVNQDGTPFIPEKNLNILSMRGTWCIYKGSTCMTPSTGKYETLKQAVVFGKTTAPVSITNMSGRGISQVTWAKPKAGEKFQLTAKTTGGGKLRMIIRDSNWSTKFDSYNLDNTKSTTFLWPQGNVKAYLYATSGIGDSSSVSGTLLRVK